jgi:hypothetical protein
VFSTDSDQPVVDTTTGKAYGYLVRLQGDIVINQIAENDVARGTLMDTVVPSNAAHASVRSCTNSSASRRGPATSISRRA